MLPQEKILKQLRNELPHLKETFGVKNIGIFGSDIKGTQTATSDIDVIVEFEKPLGLSFMDLADYLGDLFGKKVDILTLEGLKSIRIKEVAENIQRSLIFA